MITSAGAQSFLFIKKKEIFFQFSSFQASHSCPESSFSACFQDCLLKNNNIDIKNCVIST